MLTLISLICFSDQMSIQNDDDKNSVLLSLHSKVQFFNSHKYLAYTFSLEAMNNTMNWFPNMMNKCQNKNITIFKSLSNEIDNNVLWKAYSPIILKPNEYIDIKESLIGMQLLQRNMNDIEKRGNSPEICYELPHFERDFIDVNRIFNSLYLHNKTALLDIFDEKLLRFDLQLHFSNLSTPLDYSENFTESFLRHTRFEWYQDNFTATVLLEIPVFSEATLYHFQPKPIIGENALFILNTHENYLLNWNQKQVFYNNITIVSFCFMSRNIRFCHKPYGSWTCEIDYLREINNRSYCLKRIPSNEVITQFGDDTYITLSSPINMKVDCKGFEFDLLLQNSTKIINNKGCKLITSFFSYSPLQPRFGIFYPNSSNISLSTKKNFITDTNDFKYTVLQTFISGLLYALSICPIIYLHRRKIEAIRRENEVSIVLPSEFGPYLKIHTEHTYSEPVTVL